MILVQPVGGSSRTDMRYGERPTFELFGGGPASNEESEAAILLFELDLDDLGAHAQGCFRSCKWEQNRTAMKRFRPKLEKVPFTLISFSFT